MLSIRLCARYALPLALLCWCAPARAGVMYSVYQGGASGTLEYQFTSQVPFSADNAPSHGVRDFISSHGFLEAPFNGTVQYSGSELSHISAWIPGGRMGVTGDTLWFNIKDFLVLQFSSGTVPTEPGTYDLVPGFIPGELQVAGSFAHKGSAVADGIPLEQQLAAGILTFVDTVVISEAPEPSSIVIAVVALCCVLPARAYCRYRSR